jgi:hypothetical protein
MDLLKNIQVQYMKSLKIASTQPADSKTKRSIRGWIKENTHSMLRVSAPQEEGLQ